MQSLPIMLLAKEKIELLQIVGNGPIRRVDSGVATGNYLRAVFTRITCYMPSSVGWHERACKTILLWV